MSRFAIRNPYFIVVVCLIIAVVGVTSLARMPVDMFPAMNIPVVVVATFYSGMPPEQIETDITSRFERFFTLGSGIEHIESRSLPGVSVIKVYFQPGTNPDSAVTTISNLAMAQSAPPAAGHAAAGRAEVRRLQPAGLPGDVQGRRPERDAAARPGAVPGAQPDRQRARAPACRSPSADATARSWCTPTRYKLEAHQLSLMDVVRSVNDSNLILPAGDVQIGPLDYNIYTNSQLEHHGRDQSTCRSRRWARRRCASPISATPRTRSRSRPTSCAWTASARSTCRC